MLIAILNQSKVVADADVAKMTEAIATQVHDDAAPIWDRAPAAVVFYTDPATVPETAYRVAIVATINDLPDGVLGGHREDQRGRLWGAVAAKHVLDNGGQVLSGDWSVSSTLSHEVLEMFVDPNCNLWAHDGKGTAYSLEVCDPVEAPTYTVGGVSVSNFVTPSWFDPLAPATAQFDKLGQLTAAYSFLKDGYVVKQPADQPADKNKKQPVYGTSFPDWRMEMKTGPLARTQQRLIQASYWK